MMERSEFAELLRSWKPPAELNRARPRDVQLSGAGNGLVILCVVLVAGGLVAGILLDGQRRKQAAESAALREHGAAAEAVITRLTRTGDKSEDHRVAYEYAVGGQTYRRTRSVSSRFWRTLHVGDRLPIRYLPPNPEISYPEGQELRVMPWWAPALLGCSFGIPALILPIGIVRQRRLLAEGRPAPAIVKGFRRVHHSHGGGGRFVSYEFPLLDGGVAKGRSTASRNTPPEGGVICILYDPDHPKRNAPYPLQLVKPAEF
ncbi:MAG TPA: DUF3592 domain-containing protein [Bryobacteraceae bacterium]|jgi:hypothetical protein